MCFSAEASFLSGGVLAIAGLLSLSLVKDRKHLPFGLIPFLFSFHQFSEGFVWLSLSHSLWVGYHVPFLYTFLLFSQVIRATRIPRSLFRIETDVFTKKLLRLLTIAGCTVSLYLLTCLFLFPVSAEIQYSHIYYDLPFPLENKILISVLYCLAIVLSPLLATNKRIKLLGVVLLFTLIGTKLFYSHYLISVWCFFSALLSVLVLYVLDKDILYTLKKKIFG